MPRYFHAYLRIIVANEKCSGTHNKRYRHNLCSGDVTCDGTVTGFTVEIMTYTLQVPRVFHTKYSRGSGSDAVPDRKVQQKT